MKKILLLVLSIGVSLAALAQPTPTYSNGPIALTNGYSLPLAYQAVGCRGQIVYPANYFGAPSGQAIERIYFVAYPLSVPSPEIYNTFEVAMKQENLSTLNTGQWVTGFTTVLSESNFTIYPVGNEWFEIELSTPFIYDPSQPLLIDIKAEQASPFSNWYLGTKSPAVGFWAQWGYPYTSPTPNFGNNNAYEYFFGFDMISLAANNAGVASILNPTIESCGDTLPVQVVIQNSGINQIIGVTVEWEVNGVAQTPFTYTGTLDTINGAGSTSDTITLGDYFFVDSNELRVWTTLPNNVPDTVNQNDTMAIEWYASYPQIQLTDETICEGSFKIMNAGEDWENVNWSTGATSASIIVSDAGVYGVTVTDDYGCTDEKNLVVTVSPTPEVEFNAEEEACGQMALNAGNSGSTFAWSNGENAQVIVVTESGGYVVTITNEDGCTGVGQTSVTIHDLPLMHLGEDFNICVDLYETRTLGGGNAYETYDWSTGDNTSTITLGGIGATTGVVEYTVTVTDENGCSNSDTVVVTYEDCIPAGLASIGSETGLELYPNPTSDGLAISLSGMNADDVEVSIVDITGRTVKTIYQGGVNSELKLDADVSALANGVYSIKVKYDDQEISRPLVVR